MSAGVSWPWAPTASAAATIARRCAASSRSTGTRSLWRALRPCRSSVICLRRAYRRRSNAMVSMPKRRRPGAGSMSAPRYVLAIDQGTTSTRCIVFDRQARPVGMAQREFPQHYPASGWVEHNAEDIWRDTLATARSAIEQSAVGIDAIAALGITNQRETTLVWDRASGTPIHSAIVWQDRRTADECARLQRDGAEALVRARTGLLLDPYFSATKLAWMLDNVPGARTRAERGELAFGT